MKKKIDGTFVSNILYDVLNSFLDEKNDSFRGKVKIISIGNDFGSQMYGKMKKKKLTEIIGYSVDAVHFDEISLEDLVNEIKCSNEDDSINGIMLQLPLPSYLCQYERVILDSIDPKKDVDGLTSSALGNLVVSSDTLEACTPKGIIALLKVYDVDLLGKNVCIINRSNIVGKPLLHMFLRENATPVMCHSKTKDLKSITRNADVLVVACNRQEMIDDDFLKEDTVVIDVGVHKNNEGKTVGDVNFDSCFEKSSLITPPVGGVGPMTICMLAYNIAKAKYGNEVDVLLEKGIEKAKQLIKH